MIQTSLRVMTYCLIATGLLVGGGCENSNIGTIQGPATPTPNLKDIKLVSEGGDTFNFGTIEMGEEFEHVFTLRNNGKEAIDIIAGPPSCTTCTSFKLDKKVLQPNETAKATVKWQVLIAKPQFRQNAPIMANVHDSTDIPKPVLKLFVEGHIAQRIVVTPGVEMWAVGNTKEGEPTEFNANVVSPIVDSFQIESITTSNPAMTVTASPMTPAKLEEFHSKSGYALKLLIAPDIPVGEFKERVIMKLLTPKPATITANVAARRTGPVEIFGENWDAKKSLLTMGSFDPKQGASARLNLFTRGVKNDMVVEKFTCPNDRFTVELKRDTKLNAGTGERQKYDLLIKVAASDRSLVYTLQDPLVIELQTNQPLVGTIKIQLRCSALK